MPALVLDGRVFLEWKLCLISVTAFQLRNVLISLEVNQQQIDDNVFSDHQMWPDSLTITRINGPPEFQYQAHPTTIVLPLAKLQSP